MSTTRALMLLTVAPGLAEMFLRDPKVRDLLDPADYISTDEDGIMASIVERLEPIERISDLQPTDHGPTRKASPEDASIAVLVVDEDGASVFQVADPRKVPEHWPWTGLDDDED